jgi:hypothetical protein
MVTNVSFPPPIQTSIAPVSNATNEDTKGSAASGTNAPSVSSGNLATSLAIVLAVNQLPPTLVAPELSPPHLPSSNLTSGIPLAFQLPLPKKTSTGLSIPLKGIESGRKTMLKPGLLPQRNPLMMETLLKVTWEVLP